MLSSDIDLIRDYISVYGEDVTLGELLDALREKQELI